MNIRQSVKSALSLLDKRDQRVLYLLTLAQAGLALFDLIGVALLGFVAALAASVVSGSTPEIVTRVLDSSGLGGTDPMMLSLILALVAATLLVTKSIVSFLIARRIMRFLANRQAVVSGHLAMDLLSKQLLFVQRRSSQETAYALTSGVNAATLGVLGNAVIIASELTLVVVLLVGLAFVDLLVTLFTVIFFALVGLVLHKVLANWAGRLGSEATQAEVSSYLSVQEVIRTYREVSVAGRRSIYVKRFQDLRWQAAKVLADLQIMSQVSKYVFEISMILGGGLLALSQLLTRDASAAVAVIVVFLAAASRIMPSLLRAQAASLNIRSSAGTAQVTFDLAVELERENERSDSLSRFNAKEQKQVQKGLVDGHAGFLAKVELSGVGVTYPNCALPAVENVSFRIPAGSSFAIVGSTGSGKSTLVDLILGVLLPDKGSIYIGGEEAASAIINFPGAIAYVPQDISIVSGTIRDNVALGLPPELVFDDRVWEALDRAQLSEFLHQQRNGLTTVVGEHGMRLSGGQRQRLGLARALYTRPTLVVLDEATSALDSETEEAVSRTLGNLEGEVTLIIVAHRLATIRHCDQVAYLENGRLVAIGTFQEVREQAPGFDKQAQLLGL